MKKDINRIAQVVVEMEVRLEQVARMLGEHIANSRLTYAEKQQLSNRTLGAPLFEIVAQLDKDAFERREKIDSLAKDALAGVSSNTESIQILMGRIETLEDAAAQAEKKSEFQWKTFNKTFEYWAKRKGDAIEWMTVHAGDAKRVVELAKKIEPCEEFPDGSYTPEYALRVVLDHIEKLGS